MNFLYTSFLEVSFTWQRKRELPNVKCVWVAVKSQLLVLAGCGFLSPGSSAIATEKGWPGFFTSLFSPLLSQPRSGGRSVLHHHSAARVVAAACWLRWDRWTAVSWHSALSISVFSDFCMFVWPSCRLTFVWIASWRPPGAAPRSCSYSPKFDIKHLYHLPRLQITAHWTKSKYCKALMIDLMLYIFNPLLVFN